MAVVVVIAACLHEDTTRGVCDMTGLGRVVDACALCVFVYSMCLWECECAFMPIFP